MDKRTSWNTDILTIKGRPDMALLDSTNTYRYIGRNGAFLQVAPFGKGHVLASLGYMEDGEAIMLECRSWTSTTSAVIRHLLDKIGVLDQVSIPPWREERILHNSAIAAMRAFR